MMETEPTVFIVDDDASVRKSLERLVRSVTEGVITSVLQQDLLRRLVDPKSLPY